MFKIPRHRCEASKRLTDTQLLTLIKALHVKIKDAYGWPRVWQVLKEYGMTASMSRKGNCREYALRRHLSEAQSSHNAAMESFFNSLKNERVHHQRYGTREEAKRDIFDYGIL